VHEGLILHRFIARIATPLLLSAFAVTAPSNAKAVTSIDMIWRATGTAGISTSLVPSYAVSGTVLVDIVLHADSVAINGVFISIEFDAFELQALGAREIPVIKLPGMANIFSPIVQGTQVDNVNGLIAGFDQATLGAGVANASRTLGSIRFHVRSTVPDGRDDIDVIGTLQNNGIDAIVTPTGLGTAVFNGAFTPEPSTGLLVAVGAALAIVRVRRRA